MRLKGEKTMSLLNAMKSDLNYTYTGLDHVYGYAGYEICVYYTKASKEIR